MVQKDRKQLVLRIHELPTKFSNFQHQTRILNFEWELIFWSIKSCLVCCWKNKYTYRWYQFSSMYFFSLHYVCSPWIIWMYIFDDFYEKEVVIFEPLTDCIWCTANLERFFAEQINFFHASFECFVSYDALR